MTKRSRFTLASLATILCAGTGAPAAAAAPPAVSPFPPPTQAHVETWAIDDGCNGGAGASSGLVRHWLTFAESNCGPNASKARSNCRSRSTVYCYSMQYLNTDWIFGGGGSLRMARVASESWFLHAPWPNQGQRIYDSAYGGGNLLNQANPVVRSFFRSYVRRHYGSDNGMLMDEQSAGLPVQLYNATCGCSSTNEIRTSAALITAHEQMSAALTHRSGAPFIQIDQSLPTNPYLPQGLGLLKPSTGVFGLSIEGEPENNGALDPYYSTLLDQIAYVANRTKGFVLQISQGAAGASYQQQSRRVTEATVLLGYSPRHLVNWADLEEGSLNLAVWPEQGIYPTNPLQSMRAPRGRGCLAGYGKVCSVGGHHDVQVARGVYRREFGECDHRGVPFGPCAAIVNTTGSTVRIRSRWLRGTYGHEITFIGGDVQSRGRLDLTGASFHAGASTVPAQDAVLLAP